MCPSLGKRIHVYSFQTDYRKDRVFFLRLEDGEIQALRIGTPSTDCYSPHNFLCIIVRLPGWFGASRAGEDPGFQRAVTLTAPTCLPLHDGTSYSWICCSRRAPDGTRSWAARIAKRSKLAEGNWHSAVLLCSRSRNLLHPDTTGCLDPWTFDARRNDLSGVDDARSGQGQARWTGLLELRDEQWQTQAFRLPSCSLPRSPIFGVRLSGMRPRNRPTGEDVVLVISNICKPWIGFGWALSRSVATTPPSHELWLLRHSPGSPCRRLQPPLTQHPRHLAKPSRRIRLQQKLVRPKHLRPVPIFFTLG